MIVLDASVVVKVLTQESGSDAAIERTVADNDRVAPDWVHIEIAAALANKIRFGGLGVDVAEQYLAAVPVFVTDLHDTVPLLSSALQLSLTLDHALYDCAYLALAVRQQCVLLTADKAFGIAARSGGFGKHVEVIG